MLKISTKGFVERFVIGLLAIASASVSVNSNAASGNDTELPTAKDTTKRVGYVTIVWHINAREPWIGRGSNAAKLEATVLKQCNKVMKGGCTVALTFSRGASILGRQASGNHFVFYSESSVAEARSGMAEQCLKLDTDCVVLNEFIAPQSPVKTSYQIPKASPDLFRRFGAVAWQSPATKPIKVWVATGRSTPQLANGDALANCRADTGSECAIGHSGADTILVVYTADGKSLAVTQESNLDLAQKMVRFICLREKQSCKVHLVADSKVEETSVHTIVL